MSADSLTHWGGEPVATLRELWGVPTVEAYERLSSTNDRAKELAAEPGHTFAVVVANQQTAGRGRRGASWHSPPGSGLWMSVVLPSAPALHLPLLVGLAAAQAIDGLEPTERSVRVGIEWPNDLVVGSRKLGGILCEGAGDAAVAGIGINVRTPAGGFPEELTGRATSLEEQGAKAMSHNTLCGLIVSALERLLARPSPRLEPEVLADLRARDALADRPVLTEEHGPGTARGIEADGALVLERPDGSRVRVLAGSVRPA